MSKALLGFFCGNFHTRLLLSTDLPITRSNPTEICFNKKFNNNPSSNDSLPCGLRYHAQRLSLANHHKIENLLKNQLSIFLASIINSASFSGSRSGLYHVSTPRAKQMTWRRKRASSNSLASGRRGRRHPQSFAVTFPLIDITRFPPGRTTLTTNGDGHGQHWASQQFIDKSISRSNRITVHPTTTDWRVPEWAQRWRCYATKLLPPPSHMLLFLARKPHIPPRCGRKIDGRNFNRSIELWL